MCNLAWLSGAVFGLSNVPALSGHSLDVCIEYGVVDMSLRLGWIIYSLCAFHTAGRYILANCFSSALLNLCDMCA